MQRNFWARHALGSATLALSATLVACGGGSDSPPPSTAPEVPAAVVVAAPTNRQAIGALVPFSSNVTDPSGSFTYRWDFGDESPISTEAAPQHAFARSGRFTVRLTVTGPKGDRVESSTEVTVADIAIAQGKVCSAADFGGWCWQNPLPQGNAVTAYRFLDDKRGWAIGQRGTLLATVDGGVTWTARRTGTEVALTAIHFVDELVGWIFGEAGFVLRTVDGGSTWTPQTIGSDVTVAKSGATSAQAAWVLDGYQRTWSTNDGGATWSSTTVAGAPSGHSVVARPSPEEAWAASYSRAADALQHTTDGGKTWTSVALPALDATRSSYVNSLTMNASGRGLLDMTESWYDSTTYGYRSRRLVWLTADAGATWTPVKLRNADVYWGTSLELARDGALFDTADTSLYVSRDFGETWTAVTLPSDLGWYDRKYQLSTAQRIVVQGSSGAHYLTTDGGAHWTALRSSGDRTASVSSLWFFGAREGLALFDSNTVMRTTDGGVTWTKVEATMPAMQGSRLQFLKDGSVGWMLNAAAGTIYRSTDKGAHWSEPVGALGTSMRLTDFHFVDAEVGYAVGYDSWDYTATTFTTTDGGISWKALKSSDGARALGAIRFTDRLHGVMAGANGVVRTTADGGVTWQARPTGTGRAITRLAYVDAQTIVGVGSLGGIIRSSDGGASWTLVETGASVDLTDVFFVDKSVGYAVGAEGLALVTRDGGLTWSAVMTPSMSKLRGAFFLDATTGWVYGDDGVILSTVAGGKP